MSINAERTVLQRFALASEAAMRRWKEGLAAIGPLATVAPTIPRLVLDCIFRVESSFSGSLELKGRGNVEGK